MKRKEDSRRGRGIETKGEARPAYRKAGGETITWRGRIERLTWGGLGLAKAEDGRSILLRSALALFPGEEVEAAIRWKPRHAEGEVQRWVRRDPARVGPGCPVAETCGGCDLWGAGAREGELKRAMAADLLRRALGHEAFGWHPAPPDARRARIQLHLHAQQLGYHRRGSHALVPVSACPAALDALSEALPRLQEAISAGVLSGKPQRWELVAGTPANRVWAVAENGRTWALEPDGWKKGEGPVIHRFGEVVLRHAPGGFFQACPEWAWTVFKRVLEGWDLRGQTLYDLYGGVGFFSAMLGSRFERRVLVEGVGPAVAFAKENLAALGVEAIEAPVETWCPEGLGEAEDLILLDPPRAGLAPELAARLHSAKASRMVLIGCDGAPFCRDLQRLAPVWAVEDLQVLDLFPRTVHAEFVALLKRA